MDIEQLKVKKVSWVVGWVTNGRCISFKMLFALLRTIRVLVSDSGVHSIGLDICFSSEALSHSVKTQALVDYAISTKFSHAS